MDAIEYIKWLMKEYNYKQSDLVFYLQSSKGYISNILSKRKRLSLNMMRKLHTQLLIPYDILMTDYELKN